MNCKQAKTQVALLIGNDLEPASLAEVRTHLGQCVGCRQHFERLSSCLEVLQAPSPAYNSVDESLWPKLSVRLASPNAGQKPHRLNGWAPTLAVAAACTAMFWVASSRWSVDRPGVMPNGTQFQAQPIRDHSSVAPSDSQLRDENELRRRRLQRDRSHDGSGIMRPSGSDANVVPVNEPAH
jgi:hypothetical protein